MRSRVPSKDHHHTMMALLLADIPSSHKVGYVEIQYNYADYSLPTFWSTMIDSKLVSC